MKIKKTASIILIILLNINKPLFCSDFQILKTSSSQIDIIKHNKIITVTAYSPEIIRITIKKDKSQTTNPFSVIQSPKGLFNTIDDSGKTLILYTEKLKITISKDPLLIKFYTSDGKLINSDFQPLGTIFQGEKTTCTKSLFKDEKFIGLGEKTGPLNRRGRTYTNWNTDHYAYSVNSDPLYSSIPFFIGIHDSLVYGIFLDNTSRTKFDFGASTDNKFYSFSTDKGAMDYYFFGSQSVADIIKNYTWLTGTMEMVPKWILGYQQCRWSYYPDSEVLRIAKTFREKNIPADVIYLDIHYMDGYKIFTWDKKRFPDPSKMISELNKIGFHVITIVDPGIKIDAGYNAYNEGVQNKYFLTYHDSSFYTGSVWPGRCHFPDFTDNKVRKWWGSKFSALIKPGVEGFWNDMNEPSVWGQSFPEFVLGKAGSMDIIRNVYGMLMAKATFEGTKKLLKNKRTFCLTRAGFAGIQRYSAVWTGDNVATDEHMMAGVLLTNSMGLSGIPLAGPDIGGFAGNPSKELFTRWMSLGVFTPFFRNHTEIDSRHQEPWVFDDRTESLSRKFINTRYQLMPYIYSIFYEASATGLPMSRSMAVYYPFDDKIFWSNFQYQYMFGPSFMVCPVKSSRKTVAVYFPEGLWYRFGNKSEPVKGPATKQVKSPLQDLPVFVKGGSVIPMQKTVQYTTADPGDTLFLHIYYGDKKTSFLYYEDDGLTMDYRKGRYCKRFIVFDPDSRELCLSRTTGTYKSDFKILKFIFHGFRDIKEIKINNRTVKPVPAENHRLKSINFENISQKIRMKW